MGQVLFMKSCSIYQGQNPRRTPNVFFAVLHLRERERKVADGQWKSTMQWYDIPWTRTTEEAVVTDVDAASLDSRQGPPTRLCCQVANLAQAAIQVG